MKNHNGMLKPGSKVLCKPGKSQSSYSYKETDIIQYFVTVALRKIIPLCHGMAEKLNGKRILFVYAERLWQEKDGKEREKFVFLWVFFC